MAKKFYYDSVGLTDLSSTAIKAGTLSSTTFSQSDSAITNEHYSKDQSIAHDIIAFSHEDAIRIDFGADVAVTDVLTHSNLTTNENDDFMVHYNSSDTDIGSAFGTNDVSPPGWDLISASSQSARYWYLRSTIGPYSGLTEVIMGVPLEFEVEPDIGGATQEIFATDINTSYGGVEYANKRHEPVSTWTLSFKNISQTFRNNLATFEANVTDYKKFVYYDDSAYNYVRLSSPIRFVEIAFERYSCTIELREQLS